MKMKMKLKLNANKNKTPKTKCEKIYPRWRESWLLVGRKGGINNDSAKYYWVTQEYEPEGQGPTIANLSIPLVDTS